MVSPVVSPASSPVASPASSPALLPASPSLRLRVPTRLAHERYDDSAKSKRLLQNLKKRDRHLSKPLAVRPQLKVPKKPVEQLLDCEVPINAFSDEVEDVDDDDDNDDDVDNTKRRAPDIEEIEDSEEHVPKVSIRRPKKKKMLVAVDDNDVLDSPRAVRPDTQRHRTNIKTYSRKHRL